VMESHQVEFTAFDARGLRSRGLSQGVEAGLTGTAGTLPSRITWDGSLYLDGYGMWEIWGETSSSCSVEVDGREASRTRGGKAIRKARDLAAGLHRLKVTYFPRAGEHFHLFWSGRPVKFTTYLNLRGPVSGQIPESNFFKAGIFGGLEGEVFTNMKFEGEPLLKRLDPEIIFHWLDSPVPIPYAIRWKGYLRVEKGGTYSFSLPTCAFSEVRVQNKMVWRNGVREDGKDSGPLVPVLNLQPGLVPLQVEFATRNCMGIDLAWTVPGQAPAFIPFSSLVPFK
jgi:hypothetical protein